MSDLDRHDPFEELGDELLRGVVLLLVVIAVIVLTLLFAPVVVSLASAHPGGLNAAGCHRERATGETHCHVTPTPEPTATPTPALICPHESTWLHYGTLEGNPWNPQPGDRRGCWSRFEWPAECCEIAGD